MKKIMLIDDRTERQILFSKDTGIDLKTYSNIFDNFTAESYEELFKEFKDDKFGRLDNYEVIITHRSAYEEINSKVIDKLKEICKQQKKSLVFFSGGISATSLAYNPDSLLINSKSFYSHNLKLFFENSVDNRPNIKILAFGEHWKVNLLLNILENINKFIGDNKDEEKIDYDDFKDKTEIDSIINILKFQEPKTTYDFIEMKDLKNLVADLNNKIKKKVVLYV